MMSPVQVIATSSMLSAQRRANEDTQAEMAQAIQAQRARIRELEVLLAQSQAEVAGLKMGLAGCVAQGKMLKGALLKVAPQHQLFGLAGGAYADGSKRTNLDVFYENAIDAKAKELKLPLAGKGYRQFAK